MNTTTLPELIDNAVKALGNGRVVNHTPNEHNSIGQSGVHTFIEDIQDIIEKIVPEATKGTKPVELNKALNKLMFNRQK